MLIDEVRDAGLACLRHQRFAERFEGFALVAVEKPERNAAGPCFVRRHDDFNAADRKCQGARGRAFHEAAPANVRHRRLLPELIFVIAKVANPRVLLLGRYY